MNRQQLIRWVRGQVAQLIHTLSLPYDAARFPKAGRSMLTDVRDKLHAVCVAMEDGGVAESHEEIYLRLFDALSIINTHLQLAGVSSAHFEDVKSLLSRVAMEVGQ